MISIVIPTYKKQQKLFYVFESVDYIMTTNNLGYELIFVDDGSNDETEEVIKKICLTHTFVKGIILDKNYGQQNATLAGIRLAKSDYIITVDDDLQYDLEIIPRMIKGLKEGFDVVYGVPSAGHKILFRRLGTIIKERVFEIWCKKPKDIRLTSYRAMKREVADFVKTDQIENVYISARILQNTRHIMNIPIKLKQDSHCQSRYKWYKLIGVLWSVLCNYAELPIIKSFRRTGVQYAVKEVIT